MKYENPEMTDLKGNQMSVVQKVKFLLKIKIYLVPNLESTIVRVLVTNVSHLYEMEIEGELTIEKDIVACIAYVRGKWSTSA